jgi:hypothetical protein
MRQTFVLISIVLSALAGGLGSPAMADTYGANNLGGSTYLTWVLRSSPSRPAGTAIGHACITRDALEAMARTANVERYQILANPQGSHPTLAPLGGVIISPNGSGFGSKTLAPTPEQQIWERLELAGSRRGLRSDLTPDEMGKACVDGGIAGALNYLESIHGDITP